MCDTVILTMEGPSRDRATARPVLRGAPLTGPYMARENRGVSPSESEEDAGGGP